MEMPEHIIDDKIDKKVKTEIMKEKIESGL